MPNQLLLTAHPDAAPAAPAHLDTHQLLTSILSTTTDAIEVIDQSLVP